MTAPAVIRLAFDSGWSDGDPGNGRLRFDSPKLSKVRFIYINARDADEALLGQLVGGWSLGDVLVIERMGAEVNRVVGWIIGPVNHRGSYYQVPVAIRSVRGAFAAYDEMELHHHSSQSIVDAEPDRPTLDLAPLPMATTITFAPSPMAPMALTVSQSAGMPVFGSFPAPAALSAPLAPLALIEKPSLATGVADTSANRIAELEGEKRALEDLLKQLLNDETETLVRNEDAR